MSRPTLYVAVTNHGYGHATRAASVVAEVQRLLPDVLIIMVTTAPRWLLEVYIPGDFIHRPRAYDVGVVQPDSLTMDKPATLEKLQQIHAQQAEIIASEVMFMQQNQVDLVLADIPPLATAIAHATGIPCWMMSNFGWDFIYGEWGDGFAAMTAWVRECFAQCDRLYRLPFHEPMTAFPTIVDTGLTGGNPRFDPQELWATLAGDRPLPAREQTILLTFGGLGLAQIPYHNLARFPDWQFLTLDQQAPELPNLIKFPNRSCRPVDLMPLCGRVVSKPGYSTFSETCRMQVPLVSITRRDFSEAAILLEGISNYAYHQILEPEEFFQGEWEFLRQPVQPPRRSDSLPVDGNETIAAAIVDYLQ